MNVGKVVDELGYLLAQAAELDKQIRVKKATLICQGYGAYEGDVFRASVSKQEGEKLDKVAVELAIKLAKFSSQYISAHTVRFEKNVVRVASKCEGKKAA